MEMMRKSRASWIVVASLLALPAGALARPLTVDPSHTSVSFQIRHLFTNVSGRFDKFEGSIEFDPEKPEATKIDGSIDAASIDTDNEKRDKHLRAADFFDVEKHPKITFKSTKVSAVDSENKTAKVAGMLNMHGVEKPVVLDAAFLGMGKDPWGNERFGFRGTTKINRKDFDLTWNETLDGGGLLIGEEVTIEINAEAMAK